MEYELERFEQEIDIGTYVKEYVDVDYFLNLCRECPSYGRVWSCPPYDFNPVSLLKSYDMFHIQGYVIKYSGERTEKEMIEVLREVKQKLSKELRLQEDDSSMALEAGSCNECERCSRSDGKKCIHPEKMRYSVESLGGNVTKILEELCGKRIQWIDGNSLPNHFILIGGILHRI